MIALAQNFDSTYYLSANDNEIPKKSKKENSSLPFSQKKKNILVIDDEATILLTLRMMFLGNSDYNLITTASPKEALEILKHHNDKFSLIIVDMMMPEISGYELLTEIKSNPKLDNIPVIVHSAMDNQLEIAKINALANEFIQKPYTKNQLLSLINKILG